uniref:Uncharacterized protein n=1 Tax=Lepeophtheirus salmonis TaxID=72036 RepID=A0A0K2U4E9_LEPSM
MASLIVDEGRLLLIKPCRHAVRHQFVSLERVSEDNVKFNIPIIFHINSLIQLLTYYVYYLVIIIMHIMHINGLVQLLYTLTSYFGY